jgi:hypothetical protein
MGEILGVGVAALAIFAIIAAGIAAMRTADVKGLREANDDLRGRVTDLKAERDDCERDLAEEKLRHEATRRDLAAVGRVVTGEAHWVAIEQQLTTNHDEVVAHLIRIAKALRQKGEV